MAAKDIEEHQFKKGESGNPSGRPKGSQNVSTQMAKMLGRIAPDSFVRSKTVRSLCKGKKRITWGDVIAADTIIKASRGDPKARKEIFDRTEGRPRQALDVGGADGGPVEVVFRVVYEDE